MRATHLQSGARGQIVRLLLFGLFVNSVATGLADAQDAQVLTLQGELRAVGVSGEAASFLHDGLGKLRYDDAHDGLQLGNLIAEYRLRMSDTLAAHLTAIANFDGDGPAVGATEAYVEWRPFPRPVGKLRVKVGAFYPPFSLEARDVGWMSPYTKSPAALTTWIGEELRTIGTEFTASRPIDLGRINADVAVTGAAFGWNDPAGTLVAERGWALHDRQTPIGGVLRFAFSRDFQPFHELDHAAGVYGGARVRGGGFELSGYHYDNHTDASAFNGDNSGWRTWFDVAGLSWHDEHWTVLAQTLNGRTFIGVNPDGDFSFGWRMSTRYLLLSGRAGANQLSVRYDRFNVTQPISEDPSLLQDDGHALTADWMFNWNSNLQFAVEYLGIRSNNSGRVFIGAPATLTERQFMLTIRYRLEVRR